MLRNLIRTTTFRLTLIFLAVFVAVSAVQLAYFAWNAQRIFTDQITQVIEAEIEGLAEQYRLGGIRRLVAIIDRRSANPDASLYTLTNPLGERIAGNIATVRPGILDRPGRFEIPYRRQDDLDDDRHQALVQVFVLPGGFRLLVGRDLEERKRLHEVIARGARLSGLLVLIVGLVGGAIVTRRVLARIDRLTDTTRGIVATDLSGRLPLAGTGDELDRLAASTNDMLDRIEGLMKGLKEVSDNIAHDLKTPLTRLRNRAEEALRGPGDPVALRGALERTIEEADGLISTFNALLLIARTESGQGRQSMAPVDVSGLVEDVAELYRPLAEEKGLSLDTSAPTGLTMIANRDLVFQALANLIDNAVKYGAGTGPATITLTVQPAGGGAAFTVADHGPGVPQADRSRITDRFVRLDQSRSEPGSGLGLSLVNAVARLHGGSVAFADNGPGLRATLLIPAPAS
jgi:signal transduction histidine kinase